MDAKRRQIVLVCCSVLCLLSARAEILGDNQVSKLAEEQEPLAFVELVPGGGGHQLLKSGKSVPMLDDGIPVPGWSESDASVPVT